MLFYLKFYVGNNGKMFEKVEERKEILGDFGVVEDFSEGGCCNVDYELKIVNCDVLKIGNMVKGYK